MKKYKELEIESEGQTEYRCTRCNMMLDDIEEVESHIEEHMHFDEVRGLLLVRRDEVENVDVGHLYMLYEYDEFGMRGFRFDYLNGEYDIIEYTAGFFITTLVPASDAQSRLFRERMTAQFGDLINNIMNN